MSSIEESEQILVKMVADSIGYGRVMQICEQLWTEKDPVGALTVGPTAAMKRIDGAIAEQLAKSLQRNSRMAARLEKLRFLILANVECAGDTGKRGSDRRRCAIEETVRKILADEEPDWSMFK